MIRKKTLEVMWNLGVNEFTIKSGDYTFDFSLDFSKECKGTTNEVIVSVMNPHWKTSICLEYIMGDLMGHFYDRYNELPPSIYKKVKKAFRSGEVKKQICTIYDKAVNDNFNIDKIKED